PTVTSGVVAPPVSKCTDGGVGSRASFHASGLAGGPDRQGASVDAVERHRDQWGMVVGDGIFCLARVEESSRGGWFSRLNADPVSKRRECAGTRHHQVG